MLRRLREIFKFLYPYIKEEKCSSSFFRSIFLIFLTSILYIPVPNLLGQTTNLLNKTDFRNNFYKFCIIIICLSALFLIRYFLSVHSKSNLSKIERITVSRIKIDMVEKYLDMPMSEIEKDNRGTIMGRIEETNQLSQMFSSGSVGLFLNFLEFIFSLIIVSIININLLFLLLLLMPIYYFCLKKTSDKIATSTLELFKMNNVVTGKIFECLNGVTDIKMTNGQKFILSGIKKSNIKSVESSYKQNRFIHIFTENAQIIYNFINIVIITFCAILILWGGLNFSEYIILSAYFIKIISFVQGVSSIDILIQPVHVAITRIKDFLSVKNESDGGTILIENCTQIDFKKVYFKYSDSESFAIKNLDLSIEVGNDLLIKGKIGSGKSTLIKLILGLYKPTHGEILINNISINDINKESLRNRIGIVSQDVVLFNDTIENNILLGNNSISRDKLKEKINDWGLLEFINSFENGLDTIISKSSIGVSGGQAKIIALLRALIFEKDIIILDEFSANLDATLTQKMINLFTMHNICKTLIVISHSDDWNHIPNILCMDDSLLEKSSI